MIIEAGALIFFSFLAIALKLKRTTLCWLLGHPIKLDLAASVLAFMLHGGSTFTGGMSATVAGLSMAMATTLGRHLIGYTEYHSRERGYVYHPGVYNFLHREVQS